MYCLLMAALFVTICSRSSFLYVMNNWDDSNCYFTVGKSMLHGKVLYRDVFDHKGPYLYLLYGIGYLLSHTSFMGVYFLEIISWTASLYVSFLIVKLFSSTGIACVLVPFFGMGVLSSVSFYWGGSAEEMFLPLLLLTLWIFLKEWKEDGDSPLCSRQIFIIGVCAGVWALVKYTLLFFFGMILLLLIVHRIVRKDYRSVFRYCYQFLAGFVLAFLPWIIYFAANGAMKDWFDSYILTNIHYAAGNSKKIGIAALIKNWVMILYWDIYDNPLYFVWIIIGMIASVCQKKRYWIERLDLGIVFLVTFVGVYLSQTMLKYYALPLCVFAPVGLGYFGSFFRKLWKKEISSTLTVACSLVITLVLGVAGYRISGNSSFMNKKDYYLLTFRDIINESENPTLLNYGCLDAGLFTLCDIQPKMKWFHQVNAYIPEMYEQQQASIDLGLTEYVYARSEKYPFGIEVNYELVSEISDEAGTGFTYYLFRKRQD